jgi:hypothetical protein
VVTGWVGRVKVTDRTTEGRRTRADLIAGILTAVTGAATSRVGVFSRAELAKEAWLRAGVLDIGLAAVAGRGLLGLRTGERE